MIELILIASILLLVAVGGLGIKLLIDKKAEFTGGSCQATHSKELQDKGVSCGCGGGHCAVDE